MTTKKNNLKFIKILLCILMLSTVFNGISALSVVKAESLNFYNEDIILSDGTYEANDVTTNHSIIIESGVVNLTLNNVNVTAVSNPAIYIKAGATLNLTVKGVNNLTGGAGFAAINVAPDYVDYIDWVYSPEKSATLTISGNGVLNAQGGEGKKNTYSAGAGIGGNGEYEYNISREDDAVDFGHIIVESNFTGTIEAHGGTAAGNPDWYNGAGAGIGAGGSTNPWGTVFGNITINSGIINAYGGIETTEGSEAGGAGIGGGGNGSSDVDTLLSEINININGGTIRAHAGNLAAGIGGGSNCNSGNINITGGNIHATTSEYNRSMSGAAIGGGDNANFTNINITGGTIIADAGNNHGGAGIGSGTNPQFGTLEDNDIYLNISGKNTLVYAYGGTYETSNKTYGGSGIGLGYMGSAKNHEFNMHISITDGATVYTYGGHHSQAIGYGYKGKNVGEYLYNGQGIDLSIDDTITLFAVNADYFLPALVAYQENVSISQIDISHSKYVSAERYLVTYTKYNETSNNLTMGDALGSLAIPEHFSTEYPKDVEIEWTLNNDKIHLEFTPTVKNINDLYYPFTGDYKRGEFELHGNWATLAPEIIKVDYKFIGSYPNDVTTPDYEYIAKHSEYDTKEQGTTNEEDWTFDGWYYDSNLTNKFIDGDVLDASTTLYGKWIKKEKIQVDYKWVGDIKPNDVNPPELDNIYKGTSYISKEQNNTQEKMIFTGWFLDEDCTIPYEDGTVLNKNTTLYGKWEMIKIEVTYEWVSEGPDDVLPPDKDTINAGTNYDSRSQNQTSEEGWIFEGWFTDEDCTTLYTDGTILNEDTVLYGKWTYTKPKINVHYEWVGQNRPNDVTTPDSDVIDKGTSYTSKVQDESEEWIFEGWYLDEECTQKYEDGMILEEDTILFGKWAKKENPAPDASKPEEPKEPIDPQPENPDITPSHPEDLPNTGDNIMTYIFLDIFSICAFAILLIKIRIIKTK